MVGDNQEPVIFDFRIDESKVVLDNPLVVEWYTDNYPEFAQEYVDENWKVGMSFLHLLKHLQSGSNNTHI